jgi:hypothetical protein
MTQRDTARTEVNRRGFFAGLAAGLGIAAVAAGARKTNAAPTAPAKGPVLYHRTAETERYLKSLT